VLEKKARLGVDAWGSDDRGVRHILDPVEALFDAEFADFDPFPWGRTKWAATLVRNILLAEPLVGQFGRCFEGVSPDEAESLAACFAFDACVRRDRLAEIVATHLHAEPVTRR
jgi:hypothetical protein